MKEGLKIMQFAGGRYGWNVTRVGWLKRIAGDEYQLLGGRTIWRKIGNYNAGGLTNLANDGLGREYDISAADKFGEDVHRLLIRRSLPANEKAWAEHCPKPKDWRDAEGPPKPHSSSTTASSGRGSTRSRVSRAG